MELFIAQIAFHATQHDVTRAIASKLHVPEYTVSMPLNFHVRLFKDKSNYRRLHKGCGTVTLPSTDVGKRFLAQYGEYGRQSITVKGRRLVLKLSNRQASTDILTSIQNSPYFDPEVREQRERKAEAMNQTSVAITQIQFCWDCRDYFLSIEWEHSCPGASISFMSDKPRMLITIPSATEQIVVDFSQINYLSTYHSSSDGAVIFLSLANPPIYLVNAAVRADQSGQKRRSSLSLNDNQGRPHEEVAPYTSLSLRLVCRSEEDLATLYELIKLSEANIYIDEEYYDQVKRRQLFSRQALEHFFTWLDTIPFIVAPVFEGLLRNGSFDPREILQPELQGEILRLIRDGRMRGDDYMLYVIQEFGRQASMLFWDPNKPSTLQQCLQAIRHQYDKFAASAPISLIPSNDDDIFMCLHVLITPTTMFVEGPLPERTNRVIRSYPRDKWSNFIRVSFVDEGKLKMQYDRDVDGADFVQSRVGPLLLNGLKIAGRKFRFLAYSQSALKEHTVWFLKSFKHNGVTVNVPTVIDSLGSFADLPFDSRLMHCPARYAARISQGFTTTDPTTVEVESIQEIPDIVTFDQAGTKWTHTDGVGTMSSDFARSIHLERQQKKRGRRLRPNDFPRALQIRFMGSKGVLSVDYALSNKTICLRPSMVKFTGTNAKTIEIAKVFDKPGPMYLNRPLIMLLEGLGVPYETFKKHQDAAVRDAHESTESFERAARFMEGHGLGSSFRLPGVFRNLFKLQTFLPEDEFFDKMLEYAENHVLRELKHKARIPVPGAYNLVGIADVHRYLKPGQIFVCIKPIDGPQVYLQGPVLVSRSPTIHPGDIQLVDAIGAPPPESPFEKESLQNTLVFSTTDSRPLPTCLGGGDLDGDEYNVIPLKDLPEFNIPAMKIAKPGQYTAPKRMELANPCQHEDIARFVMDYITSDVLGYIAISWRIIADQKPEGIFHPDCLRLSDLHSIAVDYPKTGRPVPMNDIPKRPTERLPDWYAPETAKTIDPDRYYPSQRAIGKLFREISLPATDTVVGMGRAQRRRFYQDQKAAEDIDDLVESFSELSFDPELESDPIYYSVKRRVEEFITVDDLEIDASWISELFTGYRSYFQNICSTHTLSNSRTAMLTEEEAIVGTIVANTSQPRKRQDHIAKLREQTDLLVRGVRENLYGNESYSHEERLVLAFVAFKFAFTFSGKRSKFGARSFGWIALGAVFEVIREIEEEELQQKRLYERHRGYDRRRY